MRRYSIYNRILAASLLPVGLVILVLPAVLTFLRIADLQESHAAQAHAIAEAVAAASEYGAFSKNLANLQTVVSAAAHKPDVQAIAIFDTHKQLLVQSGLLHQEQLQSFANHEYQTTGLPAGSEIVTVPIVSQTIGLSDPYLDAAPPASGNTEIGRVMVIVSRASLIARGWRAIVITLAVSTGALILGGYLAWRMARDVQRPIRDIERKIQRIAQGEFSVSEISPTDPLRSLQIDIQHMAQRLAQSREHLEQQVAERTAELTNTLALQHRLEEQLRALSETDSLTGLWNRRYFEKIVEIEVERARRYGHPISLLIFDVDFFKVINDTFGHDGGDAVLVELAKVVCRCTRESDVVTRWGGEEFTILMPYAALDTAAKVAEKIRRAIETHRFPHEYKVTISIGVAEWSLTTETIDTLLSRADEALYQAKNNGRNRSVISFPALPRPSSMNIQS